MAVRYNSIKRYFFPRRFTLAALFLFSGALTFVIGAGYNILLPIIVGGVLMAAALVALGMAIASRLVTEKTLDSAKDELSGGLLERALACFGLSEAPAAAPPVLITGYYFCPTKGAPNPATGESKLEPALIKIGKDGVPRANNCQSIALLFGQDRLYWFDRRFSLVFEQDVLEEGVEVEYASIRSATANQVKLACITPKWQELLVFAKHLRVECEDRVLEVWIPGDAVAEAAERLRGLVKAAKKRSKQAKE